MAGCCLSLYDLMQSCARGEAGRLSQAKVRHEASSRTRSLVLDILLRAAGAGLIPRFAAASGDSLRPRRTSCKGDVHSSQAFGVSRSRLSWRGKALDASCSAAGFCAPTTVFPLGLPPQMSSRSILSNQFSVQLSSFLSCTCGAGPLEAQKSSFPLSFPTIAPICPGPAGCEPPAPHAPAARPRVRAGRVERVAAGKAFFILCLLVQRVFADVTSTVKIRTRFWIFRMVFLPGRPRKSPTDIHGMFAETRTRYRA